MKLRGRAFVRSTMLCTALVMTFVSTARGSSISGQFNGTFGGATTGTLPTGIAQGDDLAGQFGYGATGYTITKPSSTETVYTINSAAPNGELLSFTIYPASNTNPVYNDSYHGGFFSITMSETIVNNKVTQTTMDIQATTFYSATLSLVLTSSTYTLGLALPTTTTALATFTASNGNLSYDPPDFTFINNAVEVPADTLAGVAGVPEPSTLVLGAVAMATIAGFTFARRNGKSV